MTLSEEDSDGLKSIKSLKIAMSGCSSQDIPFGNVRTAIMSEDGSLSPKCDGSMQFGHVRTAMVCMDEHPEMRHSRSSQSSVSRGSQGNSSKSSLVQRVKKSGSRNRWFELLYHA